MKNIHVLPTDKPSRTYKIDSIGKLDWSEGYLHQVDGTTNQNIYITSDEEVKDGDWHILKDGDYKGELRRLITKPINSYISAKIILTTDVDLIKDGVQAIYDQFLEWFVKNSSCEEIEIIKEQYYQFVGNTKLPLKPNYKIVIPKEESKQETVEEYFLSCIKNVLQFSNDAQAIRFMEKYYESKKEQERSYCKEEVLELLNKREDCINQTSSIFEYTTAKDWFEKFKKK